VAEKDIWLCWALEALFRMPGALPMAFKGGTSLSKVFNAIQRVSEDIDISVDIRSFVDLPSDRSCHRGKARPSSTGSALWKMKSTT
jgi:predicted nucleotidyltransferase component of viral defense system